MSLKYTLRFNWRDIRGWSETFYTDSTAAIDAPEVTDFIRRMAAARVGCLTNGATLLATRVADVATPQVSRTVEQGLQGTAGNGILANDTTDVVNLAVLVNFFSGTGVRRSYLMRGLTDADIVQGELTFAYTGRGKYNTWWNFIKNNMAVQDVVNGAFKDVAGVDGAGIVTTTAAHGLAVGDTVLVKTRTDGNGPRVRALGIVESVINATTVRLKTWNWGNCAGGQICSVTKAYPRFSSFQLVLPAYVRTRQTGHPFGLLRGRQSKR